MKLDESSLDLRSIFDGIKNFLNISPPFEHLYICVCIRVFSSKNQEHPLIIGQFVSQNSTLVMHHVAFCTATVIGKLSLKEKKPAHPNIEHPLKTFVLHWNSHICGTMGVCNRKGGWDGFRIL